MTAQTRGLPEPAIIVSCEPLTVEIYVLLPGVKLMAVRGYHRQIVAASQCGKQRIHVARGNDRVIQSNSHR
jgi:hypothetical protein